MFPPLIFFLNETPLDEIDMLSSLLRPLFMPVLAELAPLPTTENPVFVFDHPDDCWFGSGAGCDIAVAGVQQN